MDAGLTQKEVAKLLGITAQAISNYERGINRIEIDIFEQMCKIYGVSIYLMLGQEPEQAILSDAKEEIQKINIPISPAAYEIAYAYDKASSKDQATVRFILGLSVDLDDRNRMETADELVPD